MRPSASRHAVDPEEQNRAEDGERDAPEIEAIDVPAQHRPADEAANERTDDADEDRDDDTTRILARHDGFGDGTGDQSEHDPSEDFTHTALQKEYEDRYVNVSRSALRGIATPVPYNGCESRRVVHHIAAVRSRATGHRA